MKHNASNQERNNEEQVINHNNGTTNTKSEISVIANCINNNFENINNSAMKDTNNMKETISKNVDMESNKQIKERAEKDVKTEEKVIRNVSENSKIAPLERFRQMIKSILNVILKMI